MIGLGLFIFFFLTLRYLNVIKDSIDKTDYQYMFAELIFAAFPAALIEFGFRLLLKAWPFN